MKLVVGMSKKMEVALARCCADKNQQGRNSCNSNKQEDQFFLYPLLSSTLLIPLVNSIGSYGAKGDRLLGLRSSTAKPLQQGRFPSNRQGSIFAFNMFLLFPAFWLIYVARGGVTKQMCRIQTALPHSMTVNKECDPRTSQHILQGVIM